LPGKGGYSAIPVQLQVQRCAHIYAPSSKSMAFSERKTMALYGAYVYRPIGGGSRNNIRAWLLRIFARNCSSYSVQPTGACLTISNFVHFLPTRVTCVLWRREDQAMVESDYQNKYREEMDERHEDWLRSINKGSAGESKAQLLKQIDAAEKLLEAIKAFKKACDRTAY
jgi:hypothetical protein